MRACWCGNRELRPFGPDYAACGACGTLVTQRGLADEQLKVSNDDADFYGKQYWLEHQQQDLSFPDIHARARRDLTERNLHWLKALLKYRLPPAKVIELGCAHASFVALLRQAGYEASGVEMSPWVVSFGRETFGVPVSVGPVEALDLLAGSLDVIALMDVLEHLPDPAATMRRCLDLLRPDGLLLIQTPQFKEEMRHEELVASNSAFLEQLKSDEHLYLFSERSVTEFFRRLGAGHIRFEPAIFAHYDMFFAVGRAPLTPRTAEDGAASLLATPNGRLALALLDLRQRELESEADRAARGEQIETLTRLLRESEKDRAARGEQIETLTRWVREFEADRAAVSALLSRLPLRILAQFADWPDLKRLLERTRPPHD